MKTPPTLFLDIQPRDRELYNYASTLKIYAPGVKWCSGDGFVPVVGSDILLSGGGTGCYYFDEKAYELFNFTNIDLYISDVPSDSKVKSIQADFATYNGFSPDTFDEEWSMMALPSYSVSAVAAQLFYLKSMLYLKPGGRLRVSGWPFTKDSSGTTLYAEGLPPPRQVYFALKYTIDMLKSLGMEKEPYTLGAQAFHNGMFRKPDNDYFNVEVIKVINKIMAKNPDLSFCARVGQDKLLEFNRQL